MDINQRLTEELGVKRIGHFGLGFYSAFMVAKKVEIITKSYRIYRVSRINNNDSCCMVIILGKQLFKIILHTSCMVEKALSTPFTGKSLSRKPLMNNIGLGQAIDAT